MGVTRTANRRYREARRRVLAVSDVCWLCGRPGADTVDHIVPYALGGADTIDNLRPAHRSCNSRRGVGKRDRMRFQRTSRDW